MDTLARPTAFGHSTIQIGTDRPTQFIDVTDRLDALVRERGIRTGLVNVQMQHTTTAIVINEHEPLLLADISDLLERIAPEDAVYRHDNVSLRTVNCVLGERPNGHSHCRALLLPTAATVNIVAGQLQLGRWQRVFFVELDGPRDRTISVMLVGEGAL